MMLRARVAGFVQRSSALARAEVLHVIRDRATVFQIVVVPVVQLLILSNVASFAIRRSPVYVVDYDRSSVSRGLVNRISASDYFEVKGQAATPEPAERALLSGSATLVVTIPHDFEETLVRTGSAPVHLDVNAEKGSAAGVVQSYATQILNAYSAELSANLPALRTPSPDGVAPAGNAMAAGVRGDRIVTHARHWYNPTLDYKHYMVPGIFVALVTIIGTLVTAQNIAREKEIGTLEQLNVTPITRAEFITAKLAPFWVLGLFNLAIGLLVGWLVYDVPVRGSLLLLFASAGVYLVVALAIGLWVSTAVDTQQQAMFVTFFILMIYLLMSGLFTPVDSMPGWVRFLSEFNPVRHFVAISRAILVKGAGLAEIARPLTILFVSAIVVLTLAIRQYEKRTA